MSELTSHRQQEPESHAAAPREPGYVVEIEDREYEWPRSTITVPEIRALGGLPSDVPVIEVDPENNERTLGESEVVTLKPGYRFGKKVRYKRGLEDRLAIELALIRRFYSGAEWHANGGGGWVRLPSYTLPAGIWSAASRDVCFEVRPGYPGEAPYGFYVCGGLRAGDARPNNYEEPASTPFPGLWAKFSWSHDGAWAPRSDVISGSNLAGYIRSFRDRLLEGA
jgi:hypothetical protein